jgi:hypothetical protein
LGDYRKRKFVMSVNSFCGLLDELDYRELYIVGEEADSKYLAQFPRHNFISSVEPVDDWNFIRRFRTIVICNSTFSWTAAALSNADVVYTPSIKKAKITSWRGLHNVLLPNWKVY